MTPVSIVLKATALLAAAALVHAILRRRGSAAARHLKLERSHLYKKLKALGIEQPPKD